MPRTTTHPKDATFNFRIDPVLKAEFTAVTEAEDKPAAQVLREFMRRYVAERAQAAFLVEADRQMRAVNARSLDPTSDEYTVAQAVEAAFEEVWRDDTWQA